MEFEFDFGQKTLSHGLKKNEAIYASVPGIAITLSHEEIVFMNKNSGTNHVMTQEVFHALSVCQNFSSVDKHVLHISQQLPELSNQVQAIQQVMTFLIKNELLIEDKIWINSLSQPSNQNSIVNAGIVIRTSDRPDQLERLLQSLVKYQSKYTHKLSIQIYDDSTTEKLSNEIEKVCKKHQSDLTINYYGIVWQRQFIQMLKTEFSLHKEIVDWLLSPKENIFTGGRVWNLALLNNAGKKFLFFDDDYIFEPRIVTNTKKTLDLDDKFDLSVGFSISVSEIKDSTEVFDEDVLNQLINSCGQTVGNWLSSNDVAVTTVEQLNFNELQRINSESIIKTVGNGTWGSPRSNSNYWLYYLDGKQKEEFWKSREVYLDNIEASNLKHYSENYEFLSMTKFSPSAIDNSSMTPFVMPVNRVEDHFFNALMLFCYPHQVSLHYPFMMGHIQKSTRDRSSKNHIAIKPNFNKFLADYALTLIETTDAVDPKLRLKTLAKYIMGMADSNDDNIHNRLKEYLLHIRSDLVLSMQEQLDKSPNAPVYWQADVRELIEANGKAVLKNTPPILMDWDEKLSVQECVEKAREELTDVAKAMEIWPDIWEFCQTNK
jgi:hypothetical protein